MLKLPESKTLNYRPDIDGLRSVAVLLVVIFHFNLIPGGRSGFMGVDVFYVISGFLITAILTKQMDAGTFSFSSFYIHRVRRLAPALFAVLVLVMLAGTVLLFPAELIDLSKQVLVSQFYVANIYYWQTINYFGLRADDVFLLHTWSLAVEEQFYLLYPLVVFLIYRFCRSKLWVILSVLFAASFALNLWFVSSKPEATFYLLPTRAWELLAGSLGFYAATHFARSRGVNELLGVVGLALIATGVLAYSDGMAFPGAFALIPTFGAALVLIGGGRIRTTDFGFSTAERCACRLYRPDFLHSLSGSLAGKCLCETVLHSRIHSPGKSRDAPVLDRVVDDHLPLDRASHTKRPPLVIWKMDSKDIRSRVGDNNRACIDHRIFAWNSAAAPSQGSAPSWLRQRQDAKYAGVRISGKAANQDGTFLSDRCQRHRPRLAGDRRFACLRWVWCIQ